MVNFFLFNYRFSLVRSLVQFLKFSKRSFAFQADVSLGESDEWKYKFCIIDSILVFSAILFSLEMRQTIPLASPIKRS